ncbi:hypothetical protein PQQ87_08345 [Paraburkholderia nemoris]|uniref:hypothetical protein n=1 Tax=Paraburkholderia nemoris TaxID=2793076 RepID=UPI0038BBC119
MTYMSCGGCGATDPSERCLGCMHDFGGPESEWVRQQPVATPTRQLEEIKQAVRDYHYALDTRQHGGIAQDRAFNAICKTLGMHWQQGAEKARRESEAIASEHQS